MSENSTGNSPHHHERAPEDSASTADQLIETQLGVALAKLPLVRKLWRQLNPNKTTVATVQEMTELANATLAYNRAIGQLQNLEALKELDSINIEQELQLAKQTLGEQRQAGDHKLKEAESEHKTRLLEQEVRRAELLNKLDRHKQELMKPEKPLPPPPLSAADDLRRGVKKDTEVDRARLQVLAEERQQCEEKVRRGEMTVEDMDHYMAVVEESINRRAARKL